MAGVHAAEAMGGDDRGCMAGSGAHLRGRHSFLIRPVSTGWGAALGRETALCVRGGPGDVLDGVRARGMGREGHDGLDKPGVWVSIV